MTATAPGIARDLVAEVLGVAPEALPEGDLPVARLAARLLHFLDESLAEESGTQHPEAWTFLLYGELIARAPEQALAVVKAMVAAAPDVDAALLIAAGPLDELVNGKGPDLLGPLQAAVAASPRFAAVLAEVTPEGSAGTPFWRAVQAMTADAVRLDPDAPLPAV